MNKQWVWGVTICAFVLFSLVPTGYELLRARDVRPDRSFELVHNYYTDYNFYLSRIRQGIEGNLLVHETYTSEPHKGSLFQIVYLAMGWVGDLLNVPWDRPGDIYHVARIIFAILALGVCAAFIKETLSEGAILSWAYTGFLLGVTASTWPKLVPVGSTWRFGGYMPWFTVMDSLQRITFLPHLLLGQAMMVFLILSLANKETLKKTPNILFLGGIALLLAIIYPPGLVVVAVTAFYLWLFDRIFWPRVVVGAMSIPALLYILLMVTVYPWKRLVEFDVLNPVLFNLWEYLLAMGPVLPLGLLGLAGWFGKGKKKEESLRPAVAWLLAFITIFVGFHFVPQQHPLRFAETLPHIPLAILAAYLLARFGKVGKAVAAIVIILGLGVMYSSVLWQRDFTDHKLIASYPLVPSGSYVMYPLKDFMDALTFLRGATKRSDVVLSMQTSGNYIPVYAGNIVYYGHANTVKFEEKKPVVEAFFAGTMGPSVAHAFLTSASISYVFFGPQEKEVGNLSSLTSVYPFLRPVYTNTYVTIYAVSTVQP